MEWLQENWFWLFVGVLFMGMHMGHGHGGHGAHGGCHGHDADSEAEVGQDGPDEGSSPHGGGRDGGRHDRH